MKIKNIRITDFRGLDNFTETNPAEINVLTGECGTGKSSFLKALNFAFVGEAKMDDVFNGADQGSVFVEFENGNSIERIRRVNGTQVKFNGKNSTAKAVNEFLYDKTGATTATFEAMSGVDYYESLSQKDLSNMLYSILPVRIDFDVLVKLIEETNGHAITDKERKFLKQFFPDMPAKFGLDAIDKAYKTVFSSRTKQNANLKAITARCEFDEKTLPQESREQIEESLEKIAKAEAEYNAQDKLISSYMAALKNHEEAKKRRAAIENDLKIYESVKQPDRAAYDNAMNKRDILNEKVRKSRDLISTFNSDIKLFVNTLDNLDKPICPISNKLVCTTDKSHIRDELNALVAKNRQCISDGENFIVECNKEIELQNKIMDTYVKDNLNWTKKQGLQKQLDDFIIPELPEKPKAIQKVDYTVLKRQLNEKLRIITAFELVKKCRAEKEECQAKVNLCEFAVTALDAKTGVRTKILQRVLAPFENLCNQKADSLRKDFRIKLQCENGIEILVEPKKGTGFISTEKISTGEFVFVAYLLMSIVQAVTGSKYLIIDNLDKLDEKAFRALIELISKEHIYEHVFLGAVNHEDTVKFLQSGIPGIKMISMDLRNKAG